MLGRQRRRVISAAGAASLLACVAHAQSVEAGGPARAPVFARADGAWIAPASDGWARRGAATELASTALPDGARQTLLMQVAQAAEPDDPVCYMVFARGARDASGTRAKYQVASDGDQHVHFRFRAPWQGKQYVRSIRPFVDEGRVLARGQLFRQVRGDDEGVGASGGTNPDGELLFAWSRATDVLELAEPVGIAVPGGALLQLEHHYDNRTGATVLDGSGVQVCVSPIEPEVELAFSWLGAEGFMGTSATGECSPDLATPIEILPVAAYTRAKGVQVKLVRSAANGEVETLFEQNFTGDQPLEPITSPFVLAPRDKLRITCTYDRSVRAGTRIDDSVCELYALHAPPGALKRVNAAALVHGPNTCID